MHHHITVLLWRPYLIKTAGCLSLIKAWNKSEVNMAWKIEGWIGCDGLDMWLRKHCMTRVLYVELDEKQPWEAGQNDVNSYIWPDPGQ